MVVRTGAFGYLQYGYEGACTYGTLACPINKVLGLEQRITNWTFTNNRITLAALNQVEPAIYAYGTTRGSLGVDFVLSNPWWLNALWDRVIDSGAACDFTHTYDINSKLPRSLSIQVGVCGATDVTRNLLGAVVNSVSLRSAIGEVVRGSADISYQTEAESGVSIDATPATDCCNFPYTFAFGDLTTTAGGGGVIAEIQSFDININQNSDLVYGHNSSEANAPYRRLFEITGSFTASYVDNGLIRDIYAQNSNDGATFVREQTTLTLAFDNDLATTAEKSITLTGTGVGFADHATSIEPNEPVFETLNWQIRDMTVVANNCTSSPP